MIQVKTYTALVNEINKRVTIAVQNVAKDVCDKLHYFIQEQYYDDPGFYPNVYKRTETFLNHTVYEMLSGNTAKVGVDVGAMHYKNGFSARQIVEYASQSMHGSPLYQTDTESFWDAFIDWADENVPRMLRDELKRQGLTVR